MNKSDFVTAPSYRVVAHQQFDIPHVVPERRWRVSLEPEEGPVGQRRGRRSGGVRYLMVLSERKLARLPIGTLVPVR